MVRPVRMVGTKRVASILRQLAFVLLAYVTSACTFAQLQPHPDTNAVSGHTVPAFEVATIKPVAPGGMHMVGVNVLAGGRVKIGSFSLKALVCAAFDVSSWQVTGIDEKLDKESYDVEAKPPDALPTEPYDTRHSVFAVEDPRLRLMLQALLIDRFQLKFHRHSEPGAVYLLERKDKALLLKPSKATAQSFYPSGEVAAVGGKGWALHDTSMPELAKFLSDYVVHRPVIDRTGLAGAFDFHSQLILVDEQFRDPDFMETLKPVIAEMGLKLTSAKGPVETLIVDFAAEPSAN